MSITARILEVENAVFVVVEVGRGLLPAPARLILDARAAANAKAVDRDIGSDESDRRL